MKKEYCWIGNEKNETVRIRLIAYQDYKKAVQWLLKFSESKKSEAEWIISRLPYTILTAEITEKLPTAIGTQEILDSMDIDIDAAEMKELGLTYEISIVKRKESRLVVFPNAEAIKDFEDE